MKSVKHIVSSMGTHGLECPIVHIGDVPGVASMKRGSKMIVQPNQIMIFVKKETLDHLQAYLKSQGDTTTTYDDIIQEWVNWQKKADEEIQQDPGLA